MLTPVNRTVHADPTADSVSSTRLLFQVLAIWKYLKLTMIFKILLLLLLKGTPVEKIWIMWSKNFDDDDDDDDFDFQDLGFLEPSPWNREAWLCWCSASSNICRSSYLFRFVNIVIIFTKACWCLLKHALWRLVSFPKHCLNTQDLIAFFPK